MKTKPKTKADFDVGDVDNEINDMQNSVARRGGRALYERKKFMSPLTFDDCDDVDDDSENEEDERARVQSRKIPEGLELLGSPVTSTSTSMYKGPPPDEGIFDGNGNDRGVRWWNDIETRAFLSGLEKFGVGKWVQIKTEYGHDLRNRNRVQVKDKYRTMKKNGGLPDKFL